MAVTVQTRDLSSTVSYLKQCQQQALWAESQTGQECSCSSPEYSPQLPWFVAQGLFEYHCLWLPLIGTVNVSQSAAWASALQGSLHVYQDTAGYSAWCALQGNMHMYVGQEIAGH